MGVGKAINIRISDELHSKVLMIAEQRSISLNRYIQETLEAAAKAERQRRFKEAIAQLAEENESVDFAFKAQSEVALGDS